MPAFVSQARRLVSGWTRPSEVTGWVVVTDDQGEPLTMFWHGSATD